jgi:hypothetical protein
VTGWALVGHGGEPVEGTPGSYVGSALYDIAPEHVPALAAPVVVLLAALAVHRWYRLLPPFVWAARLRALPVERRITVWMLLSSACVHALIAPAHGVSPWSLAFAADAALLAWAAHALVVGRRRAGRLATVALLGSLLGLFVGIAARETPDQVAMACKVVEITGLLALGSPLTARRRRRLLTTSGTLAATVVLVVGVWTAALAGTGSGGHHGGGAPAAGVALPAGHGHAATAAERAAADALYRRLRTAIAPYADPDVAVAAGYQARGIRGIGFHADNPGYLGDDRVLDPERPETLVYAARDDGTPVLLGAMFQVQGIRTPGPAVGGPLTVWHAHEQVCLALLPPSIAGLTSPLGTCPAGSVTVALTNEMIHVWTVPGAPARFGDLSDEWVKTNVLRAG